MIRIYRTKASALRRLEHLRRSYPDCRWEIYMKTFDDGEIRYVIGRRLNGHLHLEN